MNVVLALLVFNLVGVLGMLFNPDFFYAPSAFGGLIMFNEGLLLFVALCNLSFSQGTILQFGRILFRLTGIQLIIGVFQVPIFVATGNSEAIIGTFSGNAEHYAGFLMIGVYYRIGMLRISTYRRWVHGMVLAITIVLILLIDNKASWLGIIVSVYYVMTRVGSLERATFARLKYIVLFIVLMFVGYGVVTSVSGSYGKFSGIAHALREGEFRNLGKIKAYLDIREAQKRAPHMIFVGSGPGNFYSRAADQFYDFGSSFYANPSQADKSRSVKQSNAMAGVIKRTTNIDPFYAGFYERRLIYTIGSAQVDSPFSSYAALLGEFGWIGFTIYLATYLSVWRRLRYCLYRHASDPTILPLVISTLGFLVYVMTVSLYNNWLESGRMTTILWAMVAMVFTYVEQKDSDDKSKAENDRRESSVSLK